MAFLGNVQQPDGSFDSFSSHDKENFKPQYRYQTVLVPALMLDALSDLPEQAGAIQHRLADFVQSQLSKKGSANYWSKQSTQRKLLPYPDDLDDTSCVYIGLFLQDPSRIDPALQAKLVRLLISLEQRPGGPYRTWFVSPQADQVWQDVDIAVNANTAHLLSLIAKPPPRLMAYLNQAVRQRRFGSRYYPDEYSQLYYLARVYQSSCPPQLARLALRLKRRLPEQTSLQTALLLRTMLWLGLPDTKPLVNKLCAAQSKDGSWSSAAFCRDPDRNGQPYYHGSASLTTALAAGALQAAQSSLAATLPAGNSIYGPAVLSVIKQETASIPPTMRHRILATARQTIASQSRPEITELPFSINAALHRPLPRSQDPWLARLSAASVLGWSAYTIFDDIMDGHSGTERLPTALSAMRISYDIYHESLPQLPVRDSFDRMDAANSWELANCQAATKPLLKIVTLPRYGNVTQLADRSIGHSLCLVAILMRRGLSMEEIEPVRQAFTHYLTARQLNDDLHDWQDDLKAGRLTYVVTNVLTDIGLRPGSYEHTEIMSRAKPVFWLTTLPRLCRQLQHQAELGLRLLNGQPFLKSQHVLTDLLEAICDSVAKTLSEQQNAIAFVKAMKHN